jgi:uncharacterized protein YceK
MRIFSRQILISTLIGFQFLQGCLTVVTLHNPEERCGAKQPIPRVYSGTRCDVHGLSADNVGVIALLDMPLSFVADTIVLPYTVYKQHQINKNKKVDGH